MWQSVKLHKGIHKGPHPAAKINKSTTNQLMARSYRIAADIETRQTVWIVDKNGEHFEMDPIQVCAYYRKKYAKNVKTVTID